jgi:hypothetical protein
MASGEVSTKREEVAGHWWVRPVILATQEAEIRRITARTKLGKEFMRPYFEKPITKIGLVEWLKSEGPEFKPSTTKKKGGI